MKTKRIRYIDKEERELIEAYKKADLKKAGRPGPEENKIYKNAAKEFIRREAKMNIRIDPLELDRIKERAALEGLRYQTFIKSILHKYITGKLMEKK
jgi:predicted DNA binding CopG/RHH family protein